MMFKFWQRRGKDEMAEVSNPIRDDVQISLSIFSYFAKYSVSNPIRDDVQILGWLHFCHDLPLVSNPIRDDVQMLILSS